MYKKNVIHNSDSNPSHSLEKQMTETTKPLTISATKFVKIYINIICMVRYINYTICVKQKLI